MNRMWKMVVLWLGAFLLWGCEQDQAVPSEQTVKEDTMTTNEEQVETADESDYHFNKIESFDGEEIPVGWEVEDGGELSLSSKHYKMGEKSLYWTWDNHSTLVVNNPHLHEATNQKNGGIKVWIYNEDPHQEQLRFEIGSQTDLAQDNPKYSFEFGLNFKGWRALWVRFEEDALNQQYENEDDTERKIMRILPPDEIASGSLYFDLVQFEDQVPWNRSADYQFPDEKRNGNKNRNYYYSTKTPTIPLESEIASKYVAAFRKIEERYEQWIFGDELDFSNEAIQMRSSSLQRFIRSGVSEFNQLQLKRNDDGTITGTPLFGNVSSHKPKFGRDVANKVFFPLAMDYKLNGNEESKQKLFELFDYFHDQGWAEGSGLGTLYLEILRYSGYFHTVYLMRDELKQTGRLERELATMNWYSQFGKTFEPYSEHMEVSADELRTDYMYKLLYVLAMDDSQQKVQYMKGLVDWMEYALEIAPGYSDTIKPDFTGFHHRGVYANAYAPQGYHVASIVYYLLHDTEFSLSEEVRDHLKNALLTQRIMSNKYDVPVGVSGRFPHSTSITHFIAPAYAYLALSQDPIDEEMASAFMRLWEPESSYMQSLFNQAQTDISYVDTLGGLQLMIQLAEKGYPAEDDPNGFWMKPYAAMAIHRRDDWMVTTKGWSQYVWDFESSGSENLFGRYVSYGATQILANGEPINAVDSGYAVDQGWDWNRWPGATTIHLPLEQLNFKNNDNKHRFFSDQTFVGGVSSMDQHGIFAMQMHDTAFDPSFRANKSVFYFDHEIIFLGSNIENTNTEHATETTIFQSYVNDQEIPNWINSDEEVTAFPYELESDDEGLVWLTDPYGNGYVVPEAKGLNVIRDVQASEDHKGNRSAGSYVTAWIDHGKSPQDAAYEYVALVQTSPQEVQAYSQSLPYQVLKKDHEAHIVAHQEHEIIGYAIFDPNLELTDGIIEKVNHPVLMMVKDVNDGVVLSVADPDLRLSKHKDMNMDEASVRTASTPQTISIELKGKWKIVSSNKELQIEDKGDGTTLELEAIDGQTIEVHLQRK